MNAPENCRVAALRRPAGRGRWAGGLAAGLLLAAAVPALAQTGRPDPRWQAWLGCWRPEGKVAPGAAAAAPLVCVTPLAGSAGVQIATVADSGIVSRDTILATGERRGVNRDGCEGWQSADWSSQGQRVYLHSEISCGGGLKRVSSGLMAMTPDGDWLDVQGVELRGQTAVQVVRYRDAGLPATLPAEVASGLAGRGMAAGLSREAATAPVALADVVEASRSLDPALIEAWLAETGQGFKLDARTLVALSDSGVNDRVIDVMVALSYPKVFAVNPASGQSEYAPAAEPGRAPAYLDSLYGQYGAGYPHPFGFTPWGWDYYACSPISYSCYSPYGWGYFGYSPYGYQPYGYGYNPWYGGYGWNYGGGTVVIVGTGTGQAAPHGRIVKGRGYVGSGTTGGTGGQAHPRGESAPSGRRAAPESGSSAGSGASAGAAPAPSSGSSAKPSSSSGEGRTAKPRP